MSFCIGVNRVGLDANNHEYSGHSAAYDVLGNRIDTIPYDKDAIEIVVLDKKELNSLRSKLNFLEDRDRFSLE